METQGIGDALQALALLALVVFYFTPSRFLNLGHWGAALLLCAFVLGPTAGGAGAVYWLALVAGAGCMAAWVYRRWAPRREAPAPPADHQD